MRRLTLVTVARMGRDSIRSISRWARRKSTKPKFFDFTQRLEEVFSRSNEVKTMHVSCEHADSRNQGNEVNLRNL